MDGVRSTPGTRVILIIYAVVVAIATGTGYIIGAIAPAGLRPPSFLGVVEFPPTPVGMAAYGGLTLALLLGVLLAGVMYVSREYVAEPETESE